MRHPLQQVPALVLVIGLGLGCSDKSSATVTAPSPNISIPNDRVAPALGSAQLMPVKTVDPLLRRPHPETPLTFDEAVAQANALQDDRNVREGAFYQEREDIKGTQHPLTERDTEVRLAGIQAARDVRTGTTSQFSKRNFEDVMMELEILQAQRTARIRFQHSPPRGEQPWYKDSMLNSWQGNREGPREYYDFSKYDR